MQILFFDTNKLFGAARFYLKNGSFDKSELRDLIKNSIHTFMVSIFVLQELERKLRLKYDKNVKLIDIVNFQKDMGLELINTRDLDIIYNDYVHDSEDAQILQDAVDIQADYLITNNTRDFKIEQIRQDFNCIVMGHIPADIMH